MAYLVRFGSYILDRRAFELRRKRQRVRVSASQMKLLLLFLERPGELVTREQITACLWEQPEYVDVTSGINTAINRLRATLGDDPSQPVYVETVVGLGYRFKATVEPVTPSEPESGRGNGFRTDDPQLQHLDSETVSTELLSESTASLAAQPSPETVLPFQPVAPPLGSMKPVQQPFYLVAAIGFVATAAVGGLFWMMRPRASQPGQDPARTIAFAEITFNDGNLPITTESISHDGRWVAYSDHRGLYTRELSTSVVRAIALPDSFDTERIAWLPDETALVVSGRATAPNGGDESQVWFVPLSGEAPRFLLHGNSDAVVSPDGRQLLSVAAQGAEIWVSAIANPGFPARRIYQAAPDHALSALEWVPGDDRFIVQDCRAATPDETEVDVQGNTRARCDYTSLSASTGQVLATEPNVRFNSAFPARDGRLYLSSDLLTEEQSHAGLFLVRTDPRTGRFQGAPHLVFKLPGDQVPNFTADDDARWMSALLRRRSSDVFLASLASGSRRLDRVRRLVHIAPDNYPHSWTADGSRVLFESSDLGDYAIYEQGLEGPAQLLARSPQNAVIPQLSPDHESVLFANVNWKPAAFFDSIYQVPVDGGEIRRVPIRGQIEDFKCPVTVLPQADSSCVVRERTGRELAFYQFDPIHGEGRAVASMPAETVRVGDWSLSGDGRTIAITVHDANQPELELVPLAGSPEPRRSLPVKLPEPGVLLSAAWAAGDAGFFAQVRTGTGYELVFLDRSGNGTVLRKTYVPIWGVPSPDGRRLAFVDQTSNTNVWIGNLVPSESAVDLNEPVHFTNLSSILNRRD